MAVKLLLIQYTFLIPLTIVNVIYKMTVLENFSLQHLNTFGIECKTRFYTEINSADELRDIIQNKHFINLPWLILGGGSNILFTQEFNGLVIKNNIKGIELIKEDNDHYFVKAGAGENWHKLVMYCIENNYAGMENLSLIPGNVGASPMQNIGAYGVEIKDVFEELEAVDLRTGEMKIFSNEECRFGYRESIFKHELKNKVLITSVTYRLRKKPKFNTSYGAIEQELEQMGVKELSIKAISQAVINIRSSKLPDPAKIGNAGSFFKNPVVAKEQFEVLKEKYPAIPAYPQADGSVKLAAGWLIEKCGWKGFRKENCGVHEKQALVLVNYGGATGKEIWNLSEELIKSVRKQFNVTLEREVNIV
jgi:UDP-N-acetylmuramate dehydrogenase